MTTDGHPTARDGVDAANLPQVRRVRGAAATRDEQASLVDLLNEGEPYALLFGGHRVPWLPGLEELVSSAGLQKELSTLIGEAARLLAPIDEQLVMARTAEFDPMAWVLAKAAGEAVPAEADLRSPAMSLPGILLTHLAAIRSLRLQGLDISGSPPVCEAGYSQGILGVESIRAGGRSDASLIATAQLIGAAATVVSRRRGLLASDGCSPMMSIAGVDSSRLESIIEDFSCDLDTDTAPVISICSGRRSVVVSGSGRQLARFKRHCEQIASVEAAERRDRQRGGALFAPRFESLEIDASFHHPGMADGVELVTDWADAAGMDVEFVRLQASAILVESVDWIARVAEIVATGAKWLLDLGPGDMTSRISSSGVRGHGVAIVSATTRADHRRLFAPGAIPEIPRAWHEFAPALVRIPDGRVVVETSFTRLTGRSPILLAGMTPTTVDAKIVAAAANAGHWAELAGGGQVSEKILTERIEELSSLLEPGRAVQFNSLLLDPYLWELQMGGRRLVQKSRASGAPIDGVIVSAGIPELDDAVSLIEDLSKVGISYVVFKPGTIKQIHSVIEIAEKSPSRSIIVHIEGGRAGGHHSWEDLDDLLIETYGALRSHDNIVICVGGGIGTPERAAQYLTGRWSLSRSYPAMPVDGILVGTAAMASLEATTSPAVKQLLVETVGTEEWIGAGTAKGGMTSGRSQLGADIHEIDNAASRCGRLLDEVAGDGAAVAERYDEIVAALDTTAKPFFGDAAEMTYQQWIERYVSLAVGENHPLAGAPDPVAEIGRPNGDNRDSVWLDISWRDRFSELLQRCEARLHGDESGLIPTLFGDPNGLEQPYEAISTLLRRFPNAATSLLHPADVSFFTTLCKTPGKPVNFVPVIDENVRSWWRSDSLWQAHDPRYRADQVCIIPGIAAVAGIDRVDEPVGELLDRFEQAAVDQLLSIGIEPAVVSARRSAHAADSGLLGLVLSAPDVMWSGRLIPNPVRRLGRSDEWKVLKNRTAVSSATGARLEVRKSGVDASDRVDLMVSLSGTWITIEISLPGTVATGGAPIVAPAHAESAMRALLAVASGADATALPDVVDGVAKSVVDWSADKIADHAGVTVAPSEPSLSPGSSPVPDALVVVCWPAVFAVIGASTTADGAPVIEGLLDLVHLDHSVELLDTMPTEPSSLHVRAEAGGVVDTAIGRVVSVLVEISDDDGHVVARLGERFAILGRTGAAALPDPARAAGALSATSADTSRRTRRLATIVAPESMSAFAVVTGDHNPIHTDPTAAALAGLPEPIVHGMWMSAAAQQVVTAAGSPDESHASRRLRAWTARFLGIVRPGASIDVRVDRVGLDRGAEIIDVQCHIDGDLVMTGTGILEAPKTVYAFPGQGIQHQGMGLDSRARSRAARDVWDRAERHTRTTLGFSIVAVVRDNPTSLKARGIEYQHPDGVLFLTQFTQVAMATLAMAQVAELREAGAFVEGSITCGHSVGEYNGLAAVLGALPLEAVIEVVFERGAAMNALVPRDTSGRSNYRLAAIRPSQIGLEDEEVTGFIAALAQGCDEFLEIVNYNLHGSQYVIAGTVLGLERLEQEVDRRRAISGGKRAFILVPGIDVPFHSTVLRTGVPDFRVRLERLLPNEIDPALLIGRYIPNLVPKAFNLSREFIEEILELVPSEPLKKVIENYDDWSGEHPAELTRVLLIELLAWQFASPVRWIETQELLFTDRRSGGLGIERFVEVGVQQVPTVAGLAENTLKLPAFASSCVEVLNVERDEAILYATDSNPELDPELGSEEAEEESPSQAAVKAGPVPRVMAPSAGPSEPRPEDLAFGASEATQALIALWTKLRADQIGPVDTIESLCDGVSSRRNQLLVDMGAELSLGVVDGAADADMPSLSAQVSKLAPRYRAFGSVLRNSINDQLSKVLGPSGRRPAAIAERVKSTWELGGGWADHVTVEVALGTREGTSVRGGPLGGLSEGPLSDQAAVEAVIDSAVGVVAAKHGVSVALPVLDRGEGATVDAAALSQLSDEILGRDGILASTARLLLNKLGHGESSVDSTTANEEDEQSERIASELGSEWSQLVAPAFDARRAVLLDDRWASSREDLARMWLESDEFDDHSQEVVARFLGTGKSVSDQASWWQTRALAAGRPERAALFGRIASSAKSREVGAWADDIAVVTGASRRSIAAAVVGELLSGGATVLATTSRLDDDRLAFYRELYRENAAYGAALWVIPANMACYADIDALIDWVGSEQVEVVGGQKNISKPAMTPSLLFPFAAPRVIGDLSDAGVRAELEMKVLLWAVQRLIGGLSAIHRDTDLDTHLHVVLPGSPNRGLFGGDGAYGEAKSALDAVMSRWKVEKDWSARVTLVQALIGWTRGTGLMGHNDPLVDSVEAAGVRTFSTKEMAGELLALCDRESRARAAREPLQVDLTGGMAEAKLDLAALIREAADPPSATEDASDDAEAPTTIAALPAPPHLPETAPAPRWAELDVEPADLVVIVGAGELGPYGSARTRFEMEVDEQLSAAGVLELAWTTGLVAWHNEPEPGWYDNESGDLVPESELADKYHAQVVERCGIRSFIADSVLSENHSVPLLASVFIDQDLSFLVSSEVEARAFLAADPEHTSILAVADCDDWQVTRKAGTEIRVPRKNALSRKVGGQIPTGFDPTRWGISADMASSIDRVSLWNIVTTVDAFITAGFSPSELMRWVHPTLVANTQGSGMGGMKSLRSLYINTLLGETRANDLLQEALPNVVAAHVVQSYVGSYGPMVHPTGACATAAVSIEEGMDKIRLGKATFAVTGGFDDLSREGIIGFADMSATADSDAMASKGISENRFSRSNDRRRGGFVESQGGGAILLARGDIALALGLPVLGVLAYAQSFGDGIHTSIPAPGLGALSAGIGGVESRLARGLASLGVSADEIAVVSKHDTATMANDPNESELHERLASALGRSDGAPLFVISQKSLTGHAKGGAAVFQLIGLCQVLAQGVIPPNRSLDCVDETMREFSHLVWAREPIRFNGHFPLKAGLLTSLGFGHVSGLIAVVHPEAFLATLEPEMRDDYVRRSEARALEGQRKLSAAMCGGAALYRRPADRRFGPGGESKSQEAAMLLDPNARLDRDGRYSIAGEPAE